MMPVLTMTRVHRPITAATTRIGTSRKARLTPTAIASMLVPKPVAARLQKPWCRVLSPGSACASGLSPFQIMCAPSRPRTPNAIQWSQAVM